MVMVVLSGVPREASSFAGRENHSSMSSAPFTHPLRRMIPGIFVMS
jgi:hypothetical protein